MNNKDKQAQQEWLLNEYQQSLTEKDQTIFSLHKEMDDLKIEMNHLKKELNDKTIENQLTKNAYLQMCESKFWKMTLPLQNLLDRWRKQEIVETEQHFEEVVTEKKLLCKGDCVTILATLESTYYCKLIQSRLYEIGVTCSIVYEEPEMYEDHLYFVVCCDQWNLLPSKYIAIQLKQIYYTSNLTDKYLNQILNSIAVLDVSTLNIQYFKTKSTYGNQFYYVPFDVVNKSSSSSYEYDAIGTYYELTPRVKALQKELSVICKSKFIDLTKEDISEYLSKTKIIIPMKECDNYLLDTNIIYQGLSENTSLLISEISDDQYEQDKLKDFVLFVYSDESLVSTVKELLENQNKYNTYLKRQSLYVNKDMFSYFFYRFLLAYDCISFDEFYDRCNQCVDFENNRICLSLPEDVERRNEFMKDNQYAFHFFPGLRHKRGWTGCGMSYKFIMKKAKELGYKELIVCEDDVLFPENFNERFEKCLEYLHKNNGWDIFQGIMADIGNVNIKSVEKKNNQIFVKLDHMMSMVFNVYQSSIFDYLIHWDATNDDLKTNTIDRALELKDLNVLTTTPFLVGHKEDLKSTIWGFDNTEYTDWIKRSSEKLQSLVDEYLSNREKEGGSC